MVHIVTNHRTVGFEAHNRVYGAATLWQGVNRCNRCTPHVKVAGYLQGRHLLPAAHLALAAACTVDTTWKLSPSAAVGYSCWMCMPQTPRGMVVAAEAKSFPWVTGRHLQVASMHKHMAQSCHDCSAEPCGAMTARMQGHPAAQKFSSAAVHLLM